MRHRLARALSGLAVAAAAGALSALVAAAPAAAANAPALPGYNVDLKQTSVSGISSGAFMAVQLGVAWSSTIVGVGAVAGGPYYCAGPWVFGRLALCMAGDPGPDDAVAATKTWFDSRQIDDPKFIGRQKIYAFSGYNDTVVATTSVDDLVRFYQHFMGQSAKGNVWYQNAIGAGHAQVTIDRGDDCPVTDGDGGDFIVHCGYDQAGIILQHIYGTLQPRQPPSGTIVTFDQAEFTAPASPASISMADVGYAYIPAACARQESCRVHVALHGCLQYAGKLKERFVTEAGYNEWADANHLIVLFPQTIASQAIPYNPKGCWDWWGYTDGNYATRDGVQIKALKAMIDRIGSGFKSAAPAAGSAAPADVAATDSTDTGIELTWRPVPGAGAYKVYRSQGAGGAFKLAGSVAGPGFGDMGLHPATAYRYQVTAVVGTAESAASPAIDAKTLAVPPRCGFPGHC